MASPVSRYQREMHENLGFFATWLPGDLLNLGDLGVFVDGSFRRRSSLAELKLGYKESSFGAPQNLNLTSKNGTALFVETSADTATPVEISASIKVEFSLQGAFLFQASNVRNKRIEVSSQLTNAILESWRKRQWDSSWYVVDSLHHADCVTIIVSDESSAGVQFNVKGAIGGIPLADP